MIGEQEVIFVYIGDSLPNYAKSSLNLALKTSGLRVSLICNDKIRRKLSNADVNYIILEEFYDPRAFHEAASNVGLPHQFRDGFWLKTLERFFVLSQFMQFYKREDIFHAELDQLLFGCDSLLNHLQSNDAKGIFLPFHQPNKAIASIFYCNDPDSLISLLAYSASDINFDNEMSLLADWGKLNKKKMHVLPGPFTEIFNDSIFTNQGLQVISAKSVGGIVDGAQLGQWIAGEDPRNIPLRKNPSNHFIESDLLGAMSKADILGMKFILESLNYLRFEYAEKGISLRIYNLHIHSKIHSWLEKSDSNLIKMIDYSNNLDPFILPTTKSIQLRYFFTTGFKSLMSDPIGVFKRFLSQFFILKSNIF